MTKRGTTNMAASVHQRLLNLSKASHRPFNDLFVYYAIERFLYRLSISRHADAFVLKGALLMLLWQAPTIRPTRDIDLLGRTSNDLEAIRILFSDICRQVVEDDGLHFDAASVKTQRIAEHADYQGVRASLRGLLGNARVAMQIDIGFSDVITPGPISVTYPVMLNYPAPQLRAYNRETAVAEKLEAMVSLGELNTRMKDFFDVWLLAAHFDFEGRLLTQAVARTFARRQTAIALEPVCFMPQFAANPAKVAQWGAFVRHGKLAEAPPVFAEVITAVATFARPVFEAAAAGRELGTNWRHPGPWK